MTERILRSLTAVAAVWLLSAGVAHAQAPVLAQPSVNGVAVNFTWSATAGALSYRLEAGVASGAYPVVLPLGNVTTFGINAPLGVFFVRVVATTAGGDVASNEVVIQVPSPPAAPTSLAVARNGTGLVAAWTPGSGGANADFFQIQIGVAPGTTIYTANVSNPGWGFPAGVPAGTYYVRAVAINSQFGNVASGPSNEVMVTMPGGAGACDAAVGDFSAAAFSGILSLNWTPIAGVANFMSVSIDGAPVVSGLPISAPNGRMNFGYNQGTGLLLPLGTYNFAVRTVFACGSEAVRNIVVVNNQAPPPGPRTPDPAPGTLLPVPNYLRTVVERTAARRPDLMFNSCVEHGGNNRFMFEVVRDLRAIDNRWGLNIKRGREGLSQDIAAYNRSALPDEGATTDGRDSRRNMSLFDIIGGHCGPSPGPNWTDVTGATVNAPTAAVWTLTYYLDGGYKP